MTTVSVHATSAPPGSASAAPGPGSAATASTGRTSSPTGIEAARLEATGDALAFRVTAEAAGARDRARRRRDEATDGR